MKKWMVEVRWFDGGLVMGKLSNFYRPLGCPEDEYAKIDEEDLKMASSVHIVLEAENAPMALYEAAKKVADEGHSVWQVSLVP
jgi:hypothetical protein